MYGPSNPLQRVLHCILRNHAKPFNPYNVFYEMGNFSFDNQDGLINIIYDHLWSRPPPLAGYRIYDDVREGPWCPCCDVLAWGGRRSKTRFCLTAWRRRRRTLLSIITCILLQWASCQYKCLLPPVFNRINFQDRLFWSSMVTTAALAGVDAIRGLRMVLVPNRPLRRLSESCKCGFPAL